MALETTTTKLFLVLVFLVAQLKSEKSFCAIEKVYLQEGDTCSQSCNADIGCCAMGLDCVDNSCQKNNLGKTCKHDSDCFFYGSFPFQKNTGVDAQCIKNTTNTTNPQGTCKLIKGINDGCTSNDDCQSGYCKNSLCAGSRTLGQQCEIGKNSSCASPYVCVNYACVSVAQQGQSCKSNPCTLDCFCDYQNLTCAKYASKQKGAQCYDSSQCATGLYCNGNCTDVTVLSSLKTCGDNGECDKNFTCSCNSYVGKNLCYPMNQVSLSNDDDDSEPYEIGNCQDEEVEYKACLAQQNCTTLDASADDTCAAQHCKSTYNSYTKCLCKISRVQYGNAVSCSVGLPVWAIILIVVVLVLVVVVVIGVVVFVVMRQRQNRYSTI